MIGTTRSRVSFFMNRFRKLGYIEYKSYGARYTLTGSVARTQCIRATRDNGSPATQRKAARPKMVPTV